jgi:hypothetical protein
VTAGPQLDHDTAYELLPWLANGSLVAAERDGVELHVRSCIVCRRELKSLERLRLAVHSQPTLHVSAEAGLDRLQRQIDSEAASRSTRRDAGYAPFFRFAAVASVGIAFLGMLLWLAPGVPDQPGYATLATQSLQRAQIDVIFNQQTAAADIQALLRTVDGEIVAGPTELGRYGVRIHGGKATDAEIAALVEQLAADPRIRFAGRAFTGSAR